METAGIGGRFFLLFSPSYIVISYVNGFNLFETLAHAFSV